MSPRAQRAALALLVSLALGCGSTPPPVASPEPAPPDAGPPPDPDRDGDGLTEANDVCPCAAEDVDGFEDGDGCPEPDNDGDRILDVCDVCPNAPETYNGHCDGDGCPDRSGICVSSCDIVILERVYFARGSASLPASSELLIRAVADTLNGNPQLTLVAVIGATDAHERRRDALARARADAVLAMIVAHGVAPERAVAEIDPSTDDTGDRPEARRSVRFEIRTIDGQPFVPNTGLDCGSGPTGPPTCEVPVCDPPTLASPPPGCGSPGEQ